MAGNDISERARVVNVGRHFRQDIVLHPSCLTLLRMGLWVIGASESGAGQEVWFPNPEFYTLQVCVEGACRKWLKDRWVDCTAGQIWILPPHVPRGARSKGNHRCSLIHVGWPGDTRDPVIQGVTETVRRNDDGDGLPAAVQGFLHEFHNRNRPAVLAGWAHAADAVAKALIGSAPLSARMQAVWRTVADDLAHPWVTGELADMLEVVPQQFRRLCAEQLGSSPIKHLTRLRMERAAAMLATTPESVERIAHTVGYADPFSFSRAFKAHHGLSPRAYRKEHRA